MTDLAAYAGLFLSALAAATILPMQSEAVLVGLLLADYSPWLLVTVASVGNVLGAAINWLLGEASSGSGTDRGFRRAMRDCSAHNPGIAGMENGRSC